jgi:hypothetical protein
MPDYEKERQEAKRQLADHEKRIKALEQRMDAQHHTTEQLLRRIEALERAKKPIS